MLIHFYCAFFNEIAGIKLTWEANR